MFVWWAGAAAEAASPTDDCCLRRDRKRADERRLKGTLTTEKPCLHAALNSGPPGGRGGNGPLLLRDLPSPQDGPKMLPVPRARARNLAIGTTEPPGRVAKLNGGFSFFMGSALWLSVAAWVWRHQSACCNRLFRYRPIRHENTVAAPAVAPMIAVTAIKRAVRMTLGAGAT